MFRPAFVALSVVSLATAALADQGTPLPAPGGSPAVAAGAELPVVPVDLSLVPPVSINGDRAALNHFSLGLGAARSGKLEGVAVAPLHWTDGEMDGLQATWAAAIAGGTVRGVQAGAVTVAPDVKGLQASNFVTLAKGDVEGVQSSGMVAIGQADLAGLQAAGVTAIATGAVTGVQASGVFNWAEQVEGVQASTVNYAGAATGVQYAVLNIGGDVTGAQFGLVNVARNVSGAQFGLVNVARSADASVGLVSLVQGGTLDVELYATEFSLANAGLRLGGSRFYGLLVGGVQPGEQQGVGEVRWTFGAGVGTRFELGERFRLDLDVLGQNVQYGRPYDTDDGENVLGSVRATVAYRAAPWLSVFAGPSVNVFASQEENKNIDLGTDVGLWNDSRAWVGFAAGVRL